MNAIARWLYELVVLLVATFAFMVLFEYGPSDYMKNAQAEFSRIVDLTKGGDNSSPAP